jgi:hypothetical protein
MALLVILSIKHFQKPLSERDGDDIKKKKDRKSNKFYFLPLPLLIFRHKSKEKGKKISPQGVSHSNIFHHIFITKRS